MATSASLHDVAAAAGGPCDGPGRGVRWQGRRRLASRGAGLGRYGVAVLGPMAVAGSHAALQLVLLRGLPPAQFGMFAFLLGMMQFGFGLSNALVGTPYTLDANDDPSRETLLLTLLKANLMLSTCWGGLCVAAVLALDGGAEAAPLGAFGALAMIRWFGRTYLYALHRPTRAAISDVVYALALVAGAGLAWAIDLSAMHAVAVLCIAAMAGIAAIGPAFLRLQFIEAWRASLRPYGPVWRRQVRWALVGVGSSEATSNAHSYAVSLVAGPAAFAPIAAAALLVKPLMLVLASLAQLERPVMARHVQAGRIEAAARTRSQYRAAALCTWAGTTLLAGALFVVSPRLLTGASYDPQTIELAYGLWTGVALMQCWSVPTNVLLQAAGWFMPLARTGALAALVTLATVVGSMPLLPPVGSLIGVLLGQVAMSAGMMVLERRWRPPLGASPDRVRAPADDAAQACP